MVALVCGWHLDHQRATAEVARRLGGGDRMVIPGHALVETYSVLTRLPPPHRLRPAACLDLIDSNFISSAEIVALGPPAYVELVRRAASNNVAGGQIYDAVIAECGRISGAEVLLTFNERHFAALVDRGVEIVVPSAE